MGGTAQRVQAAGASGRLDLHPRMPVALGAAFKVVPQLSRYSLVSAIALALDFTIFLVLAGAYASPTLAGVIGYAAGTILHFLLSTRFVFDAHAARKVRGRLFGEFALTGIAGMGLTAIVIGLATAVFGLPALPAKIVAAGVSFLAVFALRRHIVFAAVDWSRPFRRKAVSGR